MRAFVFVFFFSFIFIPAYQHVDVAQLRCACKEFKLVHFMITWGWILLVYLILLYFGVNWDACVDLNYTQQYIEYQHRTAMILSTNFRQFWQTNKLVDSRVVKYLEFVLQFKMVAPRHGCTYWPLSEMLDRFLDEQQNKLLVIL